MTLIVVSGAIANKLNQGGEAWVRLSYVKGLEQLGFRVHFIEQIARSTCVDERGECCEFESSANRAYFEDVKRDFNVNATLIPVDDDGAATYDSALDDIAAESAGLFNVSGHLDIQSLFGRFRRKIFIDIDPGYTQFWQAAGNAGPRLVGHDLFYTVGENIGRQQCSIPANGATLRPTRPPVVLSDWQVSMSAENRSFTTVANWRGSYGCVEFGGRKFGLKAHEFRKFIDLPSAAAAPFEIALQIHPADWKDKQQLEQHGWRLVDPLSASSTPQRFRTYVQHSGAEFSVAQGIYVETGSGWFSDRTVRYLASGKPALVQETGFSRNYASGNGLIPFATMEEAIAGARAIKKDYTMHCAAARQIAEDAFDAKKVLGQLLKDVLA